MNAAFIARLLVITAELAQLVNEIQSNAPDTWAQVSQNYAEALQLWQNIATSATTKP